MSELTESSISWSEPKGNEKSVRLSESPTYPGNLTGFNCSSLKFEFEFPQMLKKHLADEFLAKIRPYLGQAIAATFYHSMQLSKRNYCGILRLSKAKAQFSRLASFHSLALKIVSGDGRLIQMIKPVVNTNTGRLESWYGNV